MTAPTGFPPMHPGAYLAAAEKAKREAEAATALPRHSGPRPIVGLIGKKRAGKDTVAATLVEEFGFVRYAFADPLRATMLDLDPIIPNYDRLDRLSSLVERDGWERAKTVPEVRRLLQAHGVAIRTHVGPAVWLDVLMAKVLEETRPVVVTDVRFPNEADAIESAVGRLVRILRPGTDSDAHVSETALDVWECWRTIDNVGGRSELRAAAVDLAGAALGWWE